MPCRDATGIVRNAPAFRPGVKRPNSVRRGVLLLDVLTQDADRWAAHAPGEAGARPQRVRPVAASQFGELLPHPPGGDTLEAVDQAGDGDLGRDVDRQVDVVGLAVELGRFALEAGADIPLICSMRSR